MGTLTGFVVIGVGILVGYVAGRTGILGSSGAESLSRLTFFVLTPFLLFAVLSRADVDTLFSSLLAVSATVAAITIAVFAIVARLVWRRSAGESVIGALSAGQVNANQIGIPLSVYLLGSAAYPAPIVLFQLLLLTPLSMVILETASSERRSVRRALRRTATNPIVLGALLGALVSISGITLPAVIMDPVQLIADAAVPMLLIGYGASLPGRLVLAPGAHRRDVLLASMLKLVVMPLLAWVLAAFVFHLDRTEILAVVVLAALPTAQNVFNFAQRYRVGEAISRDTVFVTTLGCVPVLLLATFLLHL